MAIHFEHGPLSWTARSVERFSDTVGDHVETGNRRWLDRATRRCLATIFDRERLDASLVLDVGSDTGLFVDWFLAQGAKVEGLDLSAAVVDRLSARYPAARFTQRSVSGTTFPSLGVFHVVNAWTEMQHLRDAAPFERALRNLTTCCDEGSRLIVCDRLGAPVDHVGSDGRQYRSLVTYDRALGALGFESVRTMPLFGQLNRARPGWDRLQDTAGALLYVMDRFVRELPTDNLSVGVWRYRGADIATLEPAAMWPLAS